MRSLVALTGLLLPLGLMGGEVVLCEGFESGLSDWSGPTNVWRVAEGCGRSGSRALVWEWDGKGPIGVLGRRIPELTRPVRAEARIWCRGDAPNKGVSPEFWICWYGKDGRWLNGGAPERMRFDGAKPVADGWRMLSYRMTERAPLGAARAEVQVWCGTKGTGRVLYDDLEIRIVDDVAVVEDFRSDAFGAAALAGKVNFAMTLYPASAGDDPKAYDVRVSYVGKDGMRREVPVGRKTSYRASAELPVEDFKMGRSEVTAIVRTAAGKELGRATTAFTRQDPAAARPPIMRPPLRVDFNAPAVQWVEALPVGNGRLGGLAGWRGEGASCARRLYGGCFLAGRQGCLARRPRTSRFARLRVEIVCKIPRGTDRLWLLDISSRHLTSYVL